MRQPQTRLSLLVDGSIVCDPVEPGTEFVFPPECAEPAEDQYKNFLSHLFGLSGKSWSQDRNYQAKDSFLVPVYEHLEESRILTLKELFNDLRVFHRPARVLRHPGRHCRQRHDWTLISRGTCHAK